MWVAFVLFPFWSVKFASWITKGRKLPLHKDGGEADINCSLKANGWKDPSSVSLLCKRFTYIWNRNHHKSAKKFWGKKTLLWRGLCNILRLGDILPVILQNDENDDNFYPIPGKKLADLIQLLHLTVFLKFYLLVNLFQRWCHTWTSFYLKIYA